MILEAIHVKNLLSHAKSYLDLTTSPLWLIWGKNGSGKSALFDGVEYALYGIHRAGKRQKMNYLIKHGAVRATIEIIFRLHGERFRVTHTIDRKHSNRGRVARWNSQSDKWETVNIGGESSNVIWDWLGQHLPQHDLFRSAIYLRQNEAAHFFDGNADKRGKRLAALIDLSQYTALSKRAEERRKAAEKQGDEARAKLEEQGDVSDQAVAAVEAEIQQAEVGVVEAQKAVDAAEIVRKGAEEWNRLLDERERKDDERQELLELIQDRDAIMAADRRITAWDVVAVQLDRYWQRISDAEKRSNEVREARAKAEELTLELEQKQVDLEQARTTQGELEKKTIPAARVALERWKQLAQALKLEADIAEARSEEESAAKEVEQLAAKDGEVREWQTRERALADLQYLVEDFEAASKARKSLQEVDRKLSDARRQEAEARQANDQAQAALEEQEELLQTATSQVNGLHAEIAKLQGQIEAHSQLEGSEPTCPVCDQPLDEATHEHVHQVLAAEQKRLDNLKRDHRMAVQGRQAADGAVKTARYKRSKAENDLREATRQLGLAEQQVETAQKAAEEAAKRLIDRRQRVELEHPLYAELLQEVTNDWVQTERERVSAGLRTAQKETEALDEAKGKQRDAQIRQSVLRSQRAVGAEPLGETLAAHELRSQQEVAQQNAQDCEDELKGLEGMEHTARELVNKLNGEVQRLDEQIKSQHNLARSAEDGARHSNDEAEDIRQELGPDWAGVLADMRHYEAENEEIERLRPIAHKLPELLQASGRLEQVDQDLDRIAKELERMQPEHCLPLLEAQKLENAARERLQVARDQKTGLEKELDNLEERRLRAETYRRDMQAADSKAADWDTLAQLLKPGGDIQVWITNQEQQQIVHEVNLVLEQLDDPLRVRLGEPIRRTGTEVQDVVVVDMTDPTEETRHFKLLSGGEQFRVALALALALHRRVVGGAPGTIIVDEGFGALDGDRRDVLAQQMADTSSGILQLGLAHNIILCSHSSEVQRHFPDRWMVEKQGGTATIHRVCDDDSLTSGSEV